MSDSADKPAKTLTEKLAGKFIVIDGPDGSGKTTQLKLLGQYLRSEGVDVLETYDPGGTVIGDKIRQLLLDSDHGEMTAACETMLYMASRAQLAAQVIRPAIEAGKCVLCDRYISATIAYQGAGGIETGKIHQIADVAVGGLWADLTVILDIQARAGLARLGGKPDRVESKTIEFHDKARQRFVKMGTHHPDRCVVIDAAGDIDQVQGQLRETITGWQFV